MLTAYAPKTHNKLADACAGVPYGHVPGHQYHDVDVVISRSRSGRFRCHAVESWGSAQGCRSYQEHGRIEVIGRGDDIREACEDAMDRGQQAGMHVSYLTSALAAAEDEAEEAEEAEEADADGVSLR
jgi:hypothetical protein